MADAFSSDAFDTGTLTWLPAAGEDVKPQERYRVEKWRCYRGDVAGRPVRDTLMEARHFFVSINAAATP